MRISFAGDKTAKIKHNNREFISANVDKSRIGNNITIVNQTVREAYEHLFGEAQQKYNSKQKRKDRKIDDYYTHLFGNVPESKQDEIQTNRNNQNSFYEYIVQIGDKDSAGVVTNPENAQIVTECLLEYVKDFQERNPNLYMFNAVLHLDETTPHLHIDVIPFSDDYKKGMDKQLSIAKAFEAMGYDKNCDNASRDFTINERKILREICKRHGLEIEKGREITFTPQQMRDGISELYDELTTTEKTLQETQQKLQEKQLALSEVTAELQTTTATVNSLQEQKKALQQEIDEDVDLIRSYTPPPTKKGKDFFGRDKEIPKTVEELKNEKLIMTAKELLAQNDRLLSEAKQEARHIVSSAETTAQEIISKAENSEIVFAAKAEAKQILQNAHSVLREAEITRDSAEDYYRERMALADEEAKERLKQLDEKEAHVNALAELSKPTAEYEERMEWLYGTAIRPVADDLAEELEEELDFDETEFEEPEYYDGYGY